MNLAPILATKLDVLRRQDTPGLRCFLLAKPGPGATAWEGVETGATVAGELRKGWRKSRRRFDRDGQPLPVEILVARSRRVTSDVLRTVGAVALVAKGETSGVLYAVSPPGIAEYNDEPVWRLTAKGRAGTWTIPTADTSEFAITLESGDALLTESGDDLLTEAA